LRELLRRRLQGTGPVTLSALANSLALPESAIEPALCALESEGFAMRGQFTPGTAVLEWCERRLLARIHRYTIQSLRAQIEPVSSADFMRFLLDWQGVTAAPEAEGIASLERVIEQLEGYEIAAAAWEEDVLPARLHDYDGVWLDSLCQSGRTYWARLTRSASRSAGPVRATPIAFLTRKNRALLPLIVTANDEAPHLSAYASAMAQYLQQHGASFFDEIVHATALLRAHAEGALAELAAVGLVSADSFGGLRALLMPLQRKRVLAARGRRRALSGLDEAGRWSLLRRTQASGDAAEQAQGMEALAWLLLRRYGVVFRRLLTRESEWLPPWHQLLRAYRRLEAQGHVRGGRFVAGVSGEQYALADAVGALRAVRKRGDTGELIALSAADPLNLIGILTPGARLAALAGNRLLLKDGVPIATYSCGEVQFQQEMSAHEQWQAQTALLRRFTPARGVVHAG
jgi:ATP-dependent Lhr-like helicase